MLHQTGHAFTEKLDIKTTIKYLRNPLYLLETAWVSPWQIMKKLVEVVDNCDTRFIQVVDNTYWWAIYGILHNLAYWRTSLNWNLRESADFHPRIAPWQMEKLVKTRRKWYDLLSSYSIKIKTWSIIGSLRYSIILYLVNTYACTLHAC